MSVQVEVFDAARRPPDPAWDAFVAATDLPAFWNGRAIHAYAGTAAETVLLARAEVAGQTAAIACYRGWRRGLPHRRFHGRHDALFEPAWRAVPPVSFHPGLVTAAGLGQHERRGVVRAVERAVRRWSGPLPTIVVYENLEATQRPPRRGRSLRQSHAAVLDVTWTDLESYLRGRPAGARRRLRRVSERVSAEAVTIGADGYPPDPRAMAELEFVTRLRHLRPGQGAGPLPLGYLPAVMSGGRAFCFGFRRAGTLLQFDLALVHGTRLTLTATGMRDDSAHDDLYAAALLQAIDWAGRHGIDRIDLGPGTLQEKLRFGARLIPQRAVLALAGT